MHVYCPSGFHDKLKNKCCMVPHMTVDFDEKINDNYSVIGLQSKYLLHILQK